MAVKIIRNRYLQSILFFITVGSPFHWYEKEIKYYPIRDVGIYTTVLSLSEDFKTTYSQFKLANSTAGIAIEEIRDEWLSGSYNATVITSLSNVFLFHCSPEVPVNPVDIKSPRLIRLQKGRPDHSVASGMTVHFHQFWHASAMQ